jgi:hypothetical protein
MKAQEIYMRHQTIYIKSKPDTEELFVEDIDYDVIQLIMVLLDLLQACLLVVNEMELKRFPS